ncbi:nitrogen fixation protein NifX [Paraburkholderia sp. JHI2823]|uniref:nitrogen fixation protein NifX n=1 Tax=Paraburkholderia sp. JHI2823 TaxID=3112960 RepID=UPI00316BA3C9
MKIAFATQDKVHIDAHFGWAKSIAVYDVTTEGHTLLQVFDFGEKQVPDGDDEKFAPKLEVIRDCAMLFVAAIGGTAAARVVALKVHPVKVPQPLPIEDILIKLRGVLKGTPPPWLRKVLIRERGRSYDFAGDDESPLG